LDGVLGIQAAKPGANRISEDLAVIAAQRLLCRAIVVAIGLVVSVCHVGYVL